MSTVKTFPPVPPPDVDELPHAPSPYGDNKLKGGQQLAISAYWLATNFLWGALLVIILPGNLKTLYPYARVPALSLFTAFAAIIAIVAPLFFGALSDRCAHKWGRRRPYMAWGIGINLLGLGLMALAYMNSTPLKDPSWANLGFWDIAGRLLARPEYVAFLAAYMVVQLGNNIASAAYMGVIPDVVPENQRGAASGYMALMSQLGTLLGAVGCAVALKGFPEWTKYALLAVVLLGVGMITLLGLKETPLPHKPAKIKWGPYIKSLWIDPKKFPDFAWVWITRALVMLGFYSVLPFINYYLGDAVRVPDVDMAAAELIGIILIASSISGIYGGYLSDRIGRKKVVFLSNGMIAVMVLAFIFTRSFMSVLIVGTVFGLGFGAYTSVDWALGTDVLPDKKHAGKDMAVWHIAMTLPQTLAAPIAGMMIQSFGMTVEMKPDGAQIPHYTNSGYASVFILCAVCFALGAYFLRNVRGVK